MIEVVLLGYQKRAGKDTLAELLVERDGWWSLAFAHKLKEICQDLYGFSDAQLYGDLKEVIDPRYNMSPRLMMQRFGTEAVRQQVWNKTWTDYIFKQEIPRLMETGQTKFVITDLRFENEVDEAIRFAMHTCDARIRFVHVHRPSIKSVDGHVSENQLESFEHWDFRITNFGTPDDMYSQFKVNYK